MLAQDMKLGNKMAWGKPKASTHLPQNALHERASFVRLKGMEAPLRSLLLPCPASSLPSLPHISLPPS